MNDTHGQHRVGRVLDELARRRVGDDDPLTGELERAVKIAKNLTRILAPCADDDAVRTKKVLHRGPFLQELGVRDNCLESETLASARRTCTAAHVPTGTVLLMATTASRFAVFAIVAAAVNTALTSGAPSGPGASRRR